MKKNPKFTELTKESLKVALDHLAKDVNHIRNNNLGPAKFADRLTMDLAKYSMGIMPKDKLNHPDTPPSMVLFAMLSESCPDLLDEMARVELQAITITLAELMFEDGVLENMLEGRRALRNINAE